jgi:hypothetical protein
MTLAGEAKWERPRVFVILDDHFAEKASDLMPLGPIWMKGSGANRAAAQTLWKLPNLPPDHVTVFNDTDETPEDAFISMLDTIDMHHPGWSSMEILGATLTPDLRAALESYGEGVFEQRANGFAYIRRP